MFLLIVWHVLMLLLAIAPGSAPGSGVPLMWGNAAANLALLGAAGILAQRLLTRELRIHYPAIHYVKWVVMILTLAQGLDTVLVHFHSDAPALLGYVHEQITFQHWSRKFEAPEPPSIHVLLVSVWLITFPFSHLMKVVFRYYHEFRWDDRPNVRGHRIERSVRRALDLPVRWSAPHIHPGRTWREVASGTTIPGGGHKQ
jgi:nitrate reductase gamma subunit